MKCIELSDVAKRVILTKLFNLHNFIFIQGETIEELFTFEPFGLCKIK